MLAALASLFIGAQAQAVRPPAGSSSAGYVIIAGVPGLRWDDVAPETTPTLWKLAERGSIGSLSVRSAHLPTCPADGWLTLGAGNYAERTRDRWRSSVPRLRVPIERPDDIGANLPDQPAIVAKQRELPYGAVPGALAESVRCTAAVGPGAAVAAARPFGRVDRYEPELPGAAQQLCSPPACSASSTSAPSPGRPRSSARCEAAAADAVLARLVAARPERSPLMVAGVSDTDRSGRLHVAIVDGPGWTGGWLTSASTGRDGYLQLVDLAATALHVLGRPEPERLFAGNPASRAGPARDLQEAKRRSPTPTGARPPR